MIRFAADRGIRVFLTTNGTLLDRARRRALLASGLTRLTVSVDGDDETHFRTRGVELEPIRQRVLALRRERDAAGAALRIDASMVVDAATEHAFGGFVAAWSPIVDRVQAIPRLTEGARRGACREPWRGQLVVLADGRVTACCADSEGTLALGNVLAEDPASIFNGPAMRALRRCHARGAFPSVCARCTEFEHPAVKPRFG
jgi:MoaA/NifB/PqqE/SkfB family radical SAM enzyme